MNRLLIVGNGFDLAHGMKTKYNEFILWYIKKCFEEAYLGGTYEDDAIRVDVSPGCSLDIGLTKYTSVSDHVDYFYNIESMLHLLRDEVYLKKDESFEYSRPFKLVTKCTFIWTIIRKSSINNWVDIEMEYFDQLTIILNNQTKAESAVQTLNSAVSEIISQLSCYLTGLPLPKLDKGYYDIIRQPIKVKDIVTMDLGIDQTPRHIMILNFNYTSLIEKYVETSGHPVNYAHGQLNHPENPLVFGFGDELNANYQKFEDLRVPGIFKFIKSFWYFRTRNYHNLLRFIQADVYQVIVLGHSCGLSDRTMLNMIFEDSNCKSIKIYHHKLANGRDNYTELTQEIARHFTNKLEMRKKIVSFNSSDYMPQANQ